MEKNVLDNKKHSKETNKNIAAFYKPVVATDKIQSSEYKIMFGYLVLSVTASSLTNVLAIFFSLITTSLVWFLFGGIITPGTAFIIGYFIILLLLFIITFWWVRQFTNEKIYLRTYVITYFLFPIFYLILNIILAR